MKSSREQVVVFGAGALGLGFLAAELSSEYDVVFVDVAAKAELLGRLAGKHACSVNLSAMRRSALRVEGLDAVMPGGPGWEQEVAEAVGRSRIVFTGVGLKNLPGLVPALARAVRTRRRRSALYLLHCENGKRVASDFRSRLRAACGGKLPPWLHTGQIVAGRMCRIERAGKSLEPVYPGAGWAVVAERLYGIPVSKSVVTAGAPLGSAFQVVPDRVFKMLDEIKLFAHNGCHALLGYMGHLQGCRRYPRLARDACLMGLAERMVFDELGPALAARYRGVFEPSDYRNYCVALLRRVVSPSFDDTIERGIRGVAGKLGPEERLVAGARFVAGAGVRPEVFATAIAAAVRTAIERGEMRGPVRAVLSGTCRLDLSRESVLVGMVERAARRL